MNEEDNIRVRFDKGETGWAIQLGDAALVVINNLPMTEKYCLGDVVELLNPEEDEMGILGKVIHRRYERQETIEYDQVNEFHKIAAVLRMLGAQVEGYLQPTDDHRGMMSVSFNGPLNPNMIARGMGIYQGSMKDGEEKEE